MKIKKYKVLLKDNRDCEVIAEAFQSQEEKIRFQKEGLWLDDYFLESEVIGITVVGEADSEEELHTVVGPIVI